MDTLDDADSALVSGDGPVTAQEVADFEARQREAREQITLVQQPMRCLRLLCSGIVAASVYSIKYCASHPVFVYLVMPAVGLWFVLEQVPGPLTELINRIEFYVEFVVWWVGLGILSSVGLGSGLQSGVLFLYPHIIKVFLAAQTCKSLDFESETDIWFRKGPHLFKCPPQTYESTPVTFWGMWAKIIPMCFLQAAGTALGEIPPYWMTRAARLAAIEAGRSSALDIPEELEATSSFTFINRGKAWLLRFLKDHGFYGVLLMASYPNIAFDLCGICCGHFLMPFWSFLGATFIGKAIIRNGYQSVVYVALCSHKYLEMLIGVLQWLAPDGLNIDQIIREVLEETKAGFESMRVEGAGTGTGGVGVGLGTATGAGVAREKTQTPGEVFFFYWQSLMALLLLGFVLSCVSVVAQYYQLVLDSAVSEKVRNRLPAKVREDMTSPKSGRLHLPLPTPQATRKAKQR